MVAAVVVVKAPEKALLARDDNQEIVPAIGPNTTCAEFDTLQGKFPKYSLIDGGYVGWTALGAAAYQGNTKLIQHIFNKDAATLNLANGAGWTPLFCAVRNNRLEAARELLLLRADPNLNSKVTRPHNNRNMMCTSYLDSMTGETTPYGVTPLWAAACKCRNTDMVKLLLRHGALLGDYPVTAKGDATIEKAKEEIGTNNPKKMTQDDIENLNAIDSAMELQLPLDLLKLVHGYHGCKEDHIKTPICPHPEPHPNVQTLLLGMTAVCGILSIIPPLRTAGALALRGVALLSALTSTKETGAERTVMKVARVATIVLSLVGLAACLPLLMILSMALDLGTQLHDMVRAYCQGNWLEGTLHLLFVIIDTLALAGLIVGSWELMVASMSVSCLAMVIAAITLGCAANSGDFSANLRRALTAVAYVALLGVGIAGAVTTSKIWADRLDVNGHRTGEVYVWKDPLDPSAFPTLPVGGPSFNSAFESARGIDRVLQEIELEVISNKKPIAP